MPAACEGVGGDVCAISGIVIRGFSIEKRSGLWYNEGQFVQKDGCGGFYHEGI